METGDVMSWQAWVVLGSILLSLVLLFLEVGSPEQVLMGTLAVLWNLRIVSTEDALSGFSNSGLVSIGALFIVMHAVDKSRVVDYAARRILGAHLRDRTVLLRVCLTVFILSAFCNNTPLVVLFMPIVRDWARTNQRAPSTFLIPLSYAAIMGGMLTTIGTRNTTAHSAKERAQAGDLLLLSLPRDRVVEIISKQEPGIRVRSLHANQVLSEQSEFVELVLSHNSPLLGQPISNASRMVNEAYNAGLIAVRSRYWGTAFATDQSEGKDTSSPFNRRASANFVAGDVILVLAQTDTTYPSAHFLLVTRLGSLPRPTSFYDLVPLLLFIPALVLTSLDVISMVQISVTLSTLFIMGGWIKATEIRTIVDWQLLILIGAALGIAQAMAKSGLAAGISKGIVSSGLPNWLTPSLLYLIVTTELVTNNAAAALGVPLAIDLAEKMGYGGHDCSIHLICLTHWLRHQPHCWKLRKASEGSCSAVSTVTQRRPSTQPSFPQGTTEASVLLALQSLDSKYREPLLAELLSMSRELRAAKDRALTQSKRNSQLQKEAAGQAKLFETLVDLQRQNQWFEERRRKLDDTNKILLENEQTQIERPVLASRLRLEQPNEIKKVLVEGLGVAGSARDRD
eukprot:Skav221824  [mRNA]  locus=scaffold885:137006:146089:+ [translate_table: standard]